MSKISITAKNGQMILLDTADVTHVQYFSDGVVVYSDQGKQLSEYYADLGGVATTSDLAAMIAGEGRELVKIPRRAQGSQTNEVKGYDYIAPDAVTFIDTSAIGNDGYLGVIIGVAGSHRIEVQLTPEEFAPILAAVTKAVPNLLSFDAKQAHARFTRPGNLYINAAHITQMNSDEYQLFVTFNGQSSMFHPLDVKAYSKEADEEGYPVDRTPLLRALAEKMLVHAPDNLTVIDGTIGFTAVRLSDIKDTHIDTNSGSRKDTFGLYVAQHPNALSEHPNALWLYFKSDDARSYAVKQLHGKASSKTLKVGKVAFGDKPPVPKK